MIQLSQFKGKRLDSILGLSFQIQTLEGSVLKRAGSQLTVRHPFKTSLSLGILGSQPELLGQEIRNHLDKEEIRERRCVVALPAAWILTSQSAIPEIPEEDLPGFLDLEAERTFPYSPDSLWIVRSFLHAPSGERWVTQLAIPRAHLTQLDNALRAARLRPLSFTLGPAAVHPPAAGNALLLIPSPASIDLHVTCHGGIAAVRSLQNVFHPENHQQPVDPDALARELRITLRQLPPACQTALQRLLILDHPSLVEQLTPRVSSLGLTAHNITRLHEIIPDTPLPSAAPPAPALAAAAAFLNGHADLEFLPPRQTHWQKWQSRFSSKKMVWTGSAAGALAVLVLLSTLFQHWQLSNLESRWQQIEPTVAALEETQDKMRRYRPWFSQAPETLQILKQVTQAFPQSGAVTARRLEIRGASAVICSGVALDNPAFLAVLDELRATTPVADLKVDQVRGKAPLEFTFNFLWGNQNANDN